MSALAEKVLLGAPADSTPLKQALLLYSATVVALMAARPAPVYAPDGRARDFGTGPGQSVLPFWIAATAPAMAFLFLTTELPP